MTKMMTDDEMLAAYATTKWPTNSLHPDTIPAKIRAAYFAGRQFGYDVMGAVDIPEELAGTWSAYSNHFHLEVLWAAFCKGFASVGATPPGRPGGLYSVFAEHARKYGIDLALKDFTDGNLPQEKVHEFHRRFLAEGWQ